MSDAPFVKLRRAAAVGLAAMFVLQNTVANMPVVLDSRTYRDLVGLTPFYDVVVLETKVDSGDLYLTGTLNKRRCTFDSTGQGLTAYAIYDDAANQRILIETKLEDVHGVKGDRPPSNDDEGWGPWRLVLPALRDTPDGYRIIAGHWCPQYDKQGGVIVNESTFEPILKFEFNTFAEGPWETSTTPQEM